MALGLVHVRGRLCRGERGKHKGKFVRCVKAGKQGYRIAADARTPRAKKGAGCRKEFVKDAGGNRRCARVCRNAKGVKTSQSFTTGCKTKGGKRVLWGAR